MSLVWANDFDGIFEAVRKNSWVKSKMLELLSTRNIVGKALEGEDRPEIFKDILSKLVNGQITLNDSFTYVKISLSRAQSIFSSDNRIFASGWEERLVRTNYSKLYNQAVLYYIIGNGFTECYVPHSNRERSDSICSRFAGQRFDAQLLLKRLEDAYEEGDFSSKEFKIPHHPHCTHVVQPIEL